MATTAQDSIGDIVRYDGWIGITTGTAPDGRTRCLFGSETNRFALSISRKALPNIEIIDLDRDELKNALALMQAFARGLVEDAKPF